MRIAIASDHAAVDERMGLIEHLKAEGHDVVDHGVAAGEAADYPDQAEKVARDVSDARVEFGVLLCGTGIGVAMAACKVPGVRAATIADPWSAEMTRRHNNANVACFGARIHSVPAMKRMLDVFLASPFDGGRHERRVGKIDALDACGLPDDARS